MNRTVIPTMWETKIDRMETYGIITHSNANACRLCFVKYALPEILLTLHNDDLDFIEAILYSLAEQCNHICDHHLTGDVANHIIDAASMVIEYILKNPIRIYNLDDRFRIVISSYKEMNSIAYIEYDILPVD